MITTNNSWVLITGASSGFGEEFARQYAEQGHSLVLVARRFDRLQALAATLRRQYRVEIVVEQVDLSDIEAITQLHRRVRERGITIDILINNAGHGLQGPFVDSPLDATLAMVQLDVASLTAVTHVFAQDMRARKRGKILLVASLLAYQGVQNFAVYAAAKTYVLRLGEALHRELKRDGVTVTTLCPGMSDTGIEAVDDAAGACRAHRYPRLAGWTHQRRGGLGEQGPGNPDLGDAALAAPGLHVARDERMEVSNSYRNGRHTPSPALVQFIAASYPDSHAILNHVLWEALRLDRPVSRNADFWLSQLHPEVQTTIYRHGTTFGVGKSFPRALNQTRLSMLERRAGLDALACLIILLAAKPFLSMLWVKF